MTRLLRLDRMDTVTKIIGLNNCSEQKRILAYTAHWRLWNITCSFPSLCLFSLGESVPMIVRDDFFWLTGKEPENCFSALVAHPPVSLMFCACFSGHHDWKNFIWVTVDFNQYEYFPMISNKVVWTGCFWFLHCVNSSILCAKIPAGDQHFQKYSVQPIW